MKKFLKISISILLFFVLLTGLVSFLLIHNYNTWEKRFERNIYENNLAILPYESDGSVEMKIAKFTLSNENTESLILSPYELSNLILLTSKGYLDKEITVRRVYIEPGNFRWNIYMEFVYKRYSVWFSVDINKDDMQTVQLYITDIKLGNYSLGRYFDLVYQINTGIANSILTVNENGFSGRYLENIELMEDKIVVKGSRY
ncbi:hypothetical protein CVU76_00455 [Candidatus Dojkabacteria bacterium HGW-Dojkabacteria-1]|uniref:Uncharacterized protein n=1 Tax=Candidatus Dojkabacteria bacterium HGW-Dojkabacteria-1 TaxID=2013761 RepID=A0A2N2F2Q9_9BACT|nr:MAG: hypothetical protein CVU76_00455 [Candidatus Dojkabacteria bacterium HGW-Dojkabacteria-1]